MLSTLSVVCLSLSIAPLVENPLKKYLIALIVTGYTTKVMRVKSISHLFIRTSFLKEKPDAKSYLSKLQRELLALNKYRFCS